MKFSIPCAAALALYPLVSAFPAPTAAPGQLDILNNRLEAHRFVPRQASTSSGGLELTELPNLTTSRPQPASSSSSSAQPPPSSSSSVTPPSSSQPPQSQSPSSTTTTQEAETSRPPVIRSSTSQTKIETTQQDGSVITITSELVITTVESPSASATPSNPAEDGGSSGPGTSTIVGLSIAGGLAALGAIAFIVWKLTNKRFSQFDNDDGAINWPDLQKEPEVIAPRPAPSVGAASTTQSSVDLKDPYAVPPLPQNNGGVGPYRDDAASGFYDPYRGPIPQTFATPPASTDGHQQAWGGGEAIPLSTYTSGRASPGPNFAYGDPYANAARSASPGPNLAYGAGIDPMQRTGTPVQRIGTPVQRIGTPVQRIGTPAGGAATFQEIVRANTPGGGAVPYRTGTPGYGYGGR